MQYNIFEAKTDWDAPATNAAIADALTGGKLS